MEFQTPSWERILELLERRASQDDLSVVLEAKIAISPEGTFLLDLRPNGQLETIRY